MKKDPSKSIAVGEGAAGSANDNAMPWMRSWQEIMKKASEGGMCEIFRRLQRERGRDREEEHFWAGVCITFGPTLCAAHQMWHPWRIRSRIKTTPVKESELNEAEGRCFPGTAPTPSLDADSDSGTGITRCLGRLKSHLVDVSSGSTRRHLSPEVIQVPIRPFPAPLPSYRSAKSRGKRL